MKLVKVVMLHLFGDNGVRKIVGKSIVIGDYPTLSLQDLEKLIDEYKRNPEPDVSYYVSTQNPNTTWRSEYEPN